MDGGVIYVLVTLVAGSVAVVCYMKRTKEPKKRECGRDYPKDTVILHQVKRGPFAPSMSGFCLKLETYLRLAKIPYQNVFSYTTGPKGKIPWIEYNGEVLGDSHHIIQRLNKELDKDLDQCLTEEQRAVARAFQTLVDEHTYWLVVHLRWVCYRKDTAKTLTQLPGLFVWAIGRRIRKATYQEGIGRHTPDEIENLLQEDLRTVSKFLGEKKFLMGDEPTEVDCSVFGQIAQARWHVPQCCRGRQLLEGELSNLVAYTDRMIELAWPDWGDCITHGFTTTPSK